MRRQLLVAVVGLAIVGLSVQPAPAITGGVVDVKNVYSNVAAIVIVKNATGVDGPVPRVSCSGTLIHPRIVLTAGHCTDVWETAFAAGIFSPNHLRVSFGVNAYDPSTWLEIEGVITHPDFPADFPDVGVVILKRSVRKLPLAVLPAPGLLDFLQATGQLREPGEGGTKFIVAGYGDQLVFPGPQIIPRDGLRRVAQSEYRALTRDWLILSQNFATGDGGTGYGDSGGPTFWTAPDGTLVLVSITSGGDPKLVSHGVTQRIDIEESLDFIEFVLWLMG